MTLTLDLDLVSLFYDEITEKCDCNDDSNKGIKSLLGLSEISRASSLPTGVNL